MFNIQCSEFVGNCITFSPHSSLDGVDHLIRLFWSEPSSFIVCASFHPQNYYSQLWALAVAPEGSKRTVACRALCFLGTCALILTLHLLARLWFTAAAGPLFQTEVFISSWDPALLHEILLSTNDEKRTWSGGFEPTPLRANIFTKQILTPKTTVPWLRVSSLFLFCTTHVSNRCCTLKSIFFFLIWLQVACIISICQSWYITVIQYEQVIEAHTWIQYC